MSALRPVEIGVIDNKTKEHEVTYTFRTPQLHIAANEFIIIAFCYDRAGLVAVNREAVSVEYVNLFSKQ